MIVSEGKYQQLVALVKKAFPGWNGFQFEPFVKDEVRYKLKAIKLANQLLSQEELTNLYEQQQYQEILKRFDKVGKSTNLLWIRVPMQGDLNILYQESLDKPAFCKVLIDLLYDNDGLNNYLIYARENNLPISWQFPTYFLYMVHPADGIFVKPSVMKWLFKFLQIDAEFQSKPDAPFYEDIIRRITQDLQFYLKGDGYLPQSMVDIQSFIWVAKLSEKKGNESDSLGMAPPFPDFFADENEANWAFDFIRDTLRKLGVENGDDPRILISHRKSEKGLYVTYCNWLILGFYHPEQEYRVRVPLIVEEADVLGMKPTFGFAQKIEEPKIMSYLLPMDQLNPLDKEIGGLFDATLAQIKERFENFGSSPYRNTNVQEIARAVFQPELRSKLLREGISEPMNAEVNSESAMNIWTPEEEKFYQELQKLLDIKGQVILYGPPGTGKTYQAKRFARWNQEQQQVKVLHPSVHYWYIVANTKALDFRWNDILNSHGQVDFEIGNYKKNFELAVPGDKVFCYQTPDRQLLGMAEIVKGLHNGPDGPCITVQGISEFKKPLEFSEFRDEPAYQESQPGRTGNRGTMFEADSNLVSLFTRMIEVVDADATQEMKKYTVKQENVEFVTFHPSFNYEDFMEGYKPTEAENGQVAFLMKSGVFRNLCQRAETDPETPYFLIIDEFNRGNVAKIFGELLTVIEKDKRGMQVLLPQSQNWFAVPPNVYIIATMNTADRSIKLLDAALKRRFAFVEMLPESQLLHVPIDNTNLSLADVMDGLNQKLRTIVGRDKQIGHAYLMPNGEPATAIDDLKRIYYYEIIPLIQEYCCDDYDHLAEIIGEDFVDREEQMILGFDQGDAFFINALTKRFAQV